MGFFSWNCKGCSKSIKAPYDVPKEIAWQNDAVCLTADGDRLMGEYNGYGEVGGREVYDDDIEMWHRRCWESEGKPNYTSSSESAADQGFFYDEE